MTINKEIKKFLLIFLIVVVIIILIKYMQKKAFIENMITENNVDKNYSNVSQKNIDENYNNVSQISILKDFYGNWSIVDDEMTNVYANISKVYTKEDIHSNISISDKEIVIDGCSINNPIVEIEDINEEDLVFRYKIDVSKFGFINNKYKIINIWKDCIASSFSFITDGEQCYYIYSGTYFKMIKEK